jgi:exodeoxyribonuclease V beta subunit
VTALDPLGVPLSGTQLVEASAGTGKTHTITTLYLRLLLERRLKLEEILVVTFTNAATAELKDRVRARIRAALLTFEGRNESDPELSELARRSNDRPRDAGLLRAALRSFDEATVFTIHGFCQKVLAEHAFESGAPFDQELVAEQLPLLLEVVQDFWARELAEASDAEMQCVFGNRGLSSLLSLARTALDWPDTPVLPAAQSASTASAVAEFLSCRARLRELWPAARAEVERLVSGAKLNRRSYGPDQIGEALGAVDALCARSDASIEGFTKGCERLRASALASALTKHGSLPEHGLFRLMDELAIRHQRARSELDRWWLQLSQRLVCFVREEMPRRKADRGIQSFDDLLRQLARALDDARGRELASRLRARYAAALVDEFQDTDPVQFAIFRSVFGGRNGTLFLIGDPKQAIYAFRGADVFAYLAAARDTRVQAWTLDTNYRSDPELVGAINTLFARPEQPFLLPEIQYRPVRARPDARARLGFPGARRAPLEVSFVPSELAGRASALTKGWGDAHLHKLVAAHISRLLASGAKIDDRAIESGDVAVLTRTNDQARRIQLELRALRIPSVMHGDASVLDSPEASELARVLAVLADPHDARAARSALATALLGLDAAQIDDLRQDEAGWERWVDGLACWHLLWVRQGFVQAFRRLMRDTRMPSRLLSLVDGDRRLTNVLHLVELLHQAALERRLGMAGLLQWFDDVRSDRNKREGIAAEAQQVRLERDDRAVQLTTMHRSKGLEYPVVYCPYLWAEGGLLKSDRRVLRYHDPDDGLRLKIDLRRASDKPAELALAEREARSESLRLAYVALTRAKQRSVVVWGAFRQTSSPLAHLLGAPASDEDSVRARLEQLRAESNGTIEIRELEAGAGSELEASPEPARSLAARSFSRKLFRCWRSSSFSALASAEEALSIPAVLGRDLDEQPPEPEPEPRSEADELVTLHAFPRGARAGDLVHHLLEHLDFAAERRAIDELVASALDRWGFEPRWREPLTNAVSHVVATRLSPSSTAPRLCDVARAHRLSELEFTFPVAPRGRPITAADLAAVLEQHRPRQIAADYPGRVARLGFEPLTGFLRGFIDLVFEHAGTFFVVDYKSNHLGARPDDYRPERIAEAMGRHHYHLQYLLYAVAVHRYLGARLAGYDFERHFAGVAYLFVRGMHPSSGCERGIFWLRPSRALIEGLSSALGGER